MSTNLKIAVLTLFWLSVSALAIIAFAGIIAPHSVKSSGRDIQLTQKINGSSSMPHDISLKVKAPLRGAQASISLDTINRSAVVSSLKLPGNLENIKIDADRGVAFLANSFSGLQIIDISDPENLRITSSLPDLGKAWEIEIRDNLLLLASASDGLYLIDITTVEAPVVLSRIKLEGIPMLGLAISGSIVYVKTGTKGLLVYDISNIKSPRLVSRLFSEHGVWGILVDKKRLFVCRGDSQLDIFDISDPVTPVKTGEVPLPDRAWDMALRDEILYLPTRNAGLILVDTINPRKPLILRSTLDRTDYDYIDLQDNTAYLANRVGGFSIFDISTPEAPILTSTFELPDRPRDIAVSGQNVFIAGGIKGLRVVDMNAMIASGQIVNFKVRGNVKKVLYDASNFYLVTKSQGLFITDVTQSGAPGAVIAHLQTNDVVNNMIRVGNFLYLAGSNKGLQIVDIATPSAPVLIEDDRFTSRIRDLVASDNRLFLADSSKGVLVVDIETPDNPNEISHIALQNVRRLAVDNQYLYVSTPSHLKIFKLETKTPLLIGEVEFPWPLQSFTDIKKIIVSGKDIFIAAGQVGLLSLDVSNPRAPKLVEVVNLDGDILDVSVQGETLLALSRQGKLWQLQKLRNNAIKRNAVLDNLGIGYNILPYTDRVIIANGIKGMSILPFPIQLDIINQENAYERVDNTLFLTLRVPSDAPPGTYNLNILSKNEHTEFIGAVTLIDAAE